MAEIRSALEIAMEKADRLGKADAKEIETEKWIDEGRRTAASYLNALEEKDLKAMVSEFSSGELGSVLKGVTQTLMRNVVLPRDRDQLKTINKALSGMVAIKGSVASQAVSKIQEILDGYLQTREHYYEQIKAQMQGRMGGVQQAMAQQYGMAVAEGGLDPEALPEFQQEWSKLDSQLKEQFEQQLAPLKAYLEQL